MSAIVPPLPLPMKVGTHATFEHNARPIGRIYTDMGMAVTPAKARARAAYVVTACNAFPELVEALKDARLFVDLVRLRAKREGDPEQAAEAEDAFRTATALLNRIEGETP